MDREASTSTWKDIQLLDSQIDHVTRLSRILSAYPLALDLSMLGSGKTFTASYMALDASFGFRRVVVIAPVSVKPKWDDMRLNYGIPIVNNISYSQLRSVKCKQPGHRLLTRRDYTTDMRFAGNIVLVDHVEFTPTPLLRTYVDEGLLLIVDEIQNVKNISSQFLACCALIKAIVTSSSRSKVLMLSGSPIDRREQVVALFRTMHVMKTDELATYNVGRRTIEWNGMDDIEQTCRGIDKETTERIFRRQTPRGCMAPVNLDIYSYHLFQRVFKKERSSAMQVPHMKFEICKLNAFFHVECARERHALVTGVAALSKACSFNTTTGRLDPTIFRGPGNALASIRQVTRALLQIETGKIGTFISAAQSVLSLNANSKVVICVNYKSTIADLKSGLSRHSPLILDGSVNVSGRAALLRKFQAPDSSHRLLIGNSMVMSTGIDLDDKDGRFPRTALVNPNYNTIALYQLGHRFQRVDTRSDARVIFVFAKHATELHVLHALSKKSDVMKKTTVEQSEAGVVFPGEYATVDGDVLLMEEKRVLIDVTDLDLEDEQRPTVFSTDALETGVAYLDESDPTVFEDLDLEGGGATEEETLEIVGS